MSKPGTLFEQLGGRETVQLAVDRFYDRVMQDERINHFFAGVDMVKQKAHQTAFMTYAFGGSEHYDGNSMREAHKHLVDNLGLKGEHFDAVVEDLMLTLQQLKVPPELLAQISLILNDASHRSDVLNQ